MPHSAEAAQLSAGVVITARCICHLSTAHLDRHLSGVQVEGRRSNADQHGGARARLRHAARSRRRPC